MKTYLREGFFTDKETTLVEAGELKATLFTYSTGVRAVRISNAKGSATVLPFDGQAVWRCDFLGRELTMKSIYDEPQVCGHFGESYGCFLMHCGLTAMGNPTAADTHPGHGELPTAKYRSAWLETGTDAEGREQQAPLHLRRVGGAVGGGALLRRRAVFGPPATFHFSTRTRNGRATDGTRTDGGALGERALPLTDGLRTGHGLMAARSAGAPYQGEVGRARSPSGPKGGRLALPKRTGYGLKTAVGFS